MKKLLSVLSAAFFIFVASIANAAPITIKVSDADLRSVIMIAANAGNLNISLDDSVKGKISVNISNVEPQKALEIIAKTANIQLVKEENIFILTSELKLVEPMQSYILPIKYGNAELLRKAIYRVLDNEEEPIKLKSIRVQGDDGQQRTYSYSQSESKFITSNSSDDDKDPRSKRVFVNPEVNALVLFGTQTEYERARELLKNLDVELKQVSVEAKILAIDKNASKNLGVEWSWVSPANYIKFGRTHEATAFELYYSATINALITEGKAKILSRPNVTTIQGKEAEIFVGQSLPVAESSVTNSTTTTSIKYDLAGIKLQYTPRINSDGTITAKIFVESSTPEYVADLKAYKFYKRSADTTVTVKDGEPMIIGGLIGAEESKSVRKIPFLGDLPILGALFRNHNNSKSESELMIFLTAHVLNGAGGK